MGCSLSGPKSIAPLNCIRSTTGDERAPMAAKNIYYLRSAADSRSAKHCGRLLVMMGN